MQIATKIASLSNLVVTEISYIQAPLDLLLDADPCEDAVQGYLRKSRVYAVIKEGEIIAVCAVLPRGNAVFELMNIAVAKDYQSQGVGSLLLQYVIDKTKALGGRKLVLGTGTFGP
ncbi:GNAT family N-acetyltransferase [Endozoicomonas sp. Mp262]|uniref:GNAT family N-acetyltransferase n=1 Tax=Endozoicomonas sp. Mp262 TaxID=2919499 RepID=UPI0021D91AEE